MVKNKELAVAIQVFKCSKLAEQEVDLLVKVATTNTEVVDKPKVGWDKHTALEALQDDIMVEGEVSTIMVEATLY